MTTDTLQPNLAWYFGVSRERGTTPRCPFAGLERCPVYFQSRALLGRAGSVGIPKEEDERLMTFWSRSDLTPITGEEAPALIGNPDHPMFSNFCPEVLFDRFKLFVSGLYNYHDSLDTEYAHKWLREQNASPDDYRWQWQGAQPRHFTECPLYAPLSIGGPGMKKVEGKDVEQRAMMLLRAIKEKTESSAQPIFISELSGLGMTRLEAETAFRYLKDKALVDTFSIPYTARINAHGIDLIKRIEAAPDGETLEFPHVVNNYYTEIQQMNSSALQQGNRPTIHEVHKESAGETRAATSTINLVTILGLAITFALCAAGALLVFNHASAETSIHLYGASIKTSDVGLGVIFLGVCLGGYIVKHVVSSLVHIGKH